MSTKGLVNIYLHKCAHCIIQTPNVENKNRFSETLREEYLQENKTEVFNS